MVNNDRAFNETSYYEIPDKRMKELNEMYDLNRSNIERALVSMFLNNLGHIISNCDWY